MKNHFLRAAALMLMSATALSGVARIQTREFVFNGSEFSISATATSASATVDGSEWNVVCSKGTTSGVAAAEYIPEGYDSAQRFNLKSSSATSYLILSTDCMAGVKVTGVEIYGWKQSTADVKVSVSNANAANVTLDNFTPVGASASSVETSLERYNNFFEPLIFKGKQEIDSRLRFYFYNSANANPVFAIARICVNYDDGVYDPIPLTFMLDGEKAESGAKVEPGTVLTVSTGDVDDVTLSYSIDDSASDDLFPAEGLTLDRTGIFTYHFTASAEDYAVTNADFIVTVGDVVGDDNKVTVEFANYEQYGLTLFDGNSESYETNCSSWTTDGMLFSIPDGEKVRMQLMGDNEEPMLALAPGATLQVVADDPSLLLIGGAAKGVNTDMLKFNLLKVPGAKNATASQTFPIPSADETRLLIISNLGDVAAGISSLTFSVEKKIETGVSDLSEEENDLETIYYDLKGNRALRPSHGLYIERKGCKSRVVRK